MTRQTALLVLVPAMPLLLLVITTTRHADPLHFSVADQLNAAQGAVVIDDYQAPSYPPVSSVAMEHHLAVRERRLPRHPRAGRVSPTAEFKRHGPSTFSIDVDTASYVAVRRYLMSGQRPPTRMIRLEEMVNYFNYDYEWPRHQPMMVTTELSKCPWDARQSVLAIGIQARASTPLKRKPVTMTYLIDVSGSMNQPNRLDLLRETLHLLVDNMLAEDRLGIVTYADMARVVLEPVGPNDSARIREVLDHLEAGGSTNGEGGLELAYQVAQTHHRPGIASRIILASDGEFPGGRDAAIGLEPMIQAQRNAGIGLTVVGVGGEVHADALLERLAAKGDGSYHLLDDHAEAQRILVDQAAARLEMVARDVKLQLDFNAAVVADHRLLGYDNRQLDQASFVDDGVDAGDLSADQQVTALYAITWVGDVAPAASTVIATLRARYKVGDDKMSDAIETWIHSPARAATMSDDMRLALAVAGFGQLLRGQDMGEWGLRDASRLLRSRRMPMVDPLLIELDDLMALAARL